MTTNSNNISETKPNEILLPKTYITRKGDLLLFAVIDEELFALVDSSKQTQKKPKERKSTLGATPEELSQFGTLEEFVLAIIDYRHKKVIIF